MIEFPLAPNLPNSLTWVNCTAPQLSSLRGRVVAVAFWHAGSTTSANLLADLTYLQKKFADGLSVIAIHVPKFDAQREPDFVARAVNRLGLRFPVASDADAVTWQQYGVRAWPSVALVDVRGHLEEILAGDHQRDALEKHIVELLDLAGEQGLRVYENAQAVSRPEPITEVAFPRGLALTPERLYVSDSGHHRVLECDHGGRLLRVFGSGSAGFADGLGAQAAFNSPGGLIVSKKCLYVADTANHAIRRVRLETGDVDTILGCGQGGLPKAADDARKADLMLDRPWDVACDGDRLFISMAASNQIWELDLASFAFRCLAGSGRLALTDGTGALAEFAQPTGMVLVQKTLYVCDSQASAVRSLQLSSGVVQTLIGEGLFEFGNEEGDRSLARLQYPLDVTLDASAPMLWITDSYNNEVGAWHLEGGGLVRFPFDHRLNCPSSILSSGTHLWIANTDAHEVLKMDIATGEVTVLPMTP